MKWPSRRARKVTSEKPAGNPSSSAIQTASVTSQNLSAAGPCAQATQAQRIEGWAAPWAGVPCGAGRACHAGSGRHASQPGTAGSVAVVRVFALRLTAPLMRVCSSGGAQPRPPSTLPACAGTQGAVGACVFAPAPHSPPNGGLFVAAGSAAHAHGPLCASARKVIGPPAARMAVPPSRATRHPCPWRCRVGVVRLRVPCAPSAAETAATAQTQQGRPAGSPHGIAYSVVAVPAT